MCPVMLYPLIKVNRLFAVLRDSVSHSWASGGGGGSELIRRGCLLHIFSLKGGALFRGGALI